MIQWSAPLNRTEEKKRVRKGEGRDDRYASFLFLCCPRLMIPSGNGEMMEKY